MSTGIGLIWRIRLKNWSWTIFPKNPEWKAFNFKAKSRSYQRTKYLKNSWTRSPSPWKIKQTVKKAINPWKLALSSATNRPEKFLLKKMSQQSESKLIYIIHDYLMKKARIVGILISWGQKQRFSNPLFGGFLITFIKYKLQLFLSSSTSTNDWTALHFSSKSSSLALASWNHPSWDLFPLPSRKLPLSLQRLLSVASLVDPLYKRFKYLWKSRAQVSGGVPLRVACQPHWVFSWFQLKVVLIRREILLIFPEQFMKEFHRSLKSLPLVEVVHIQLDKKDGTCLMKEERLECLK